MNDHLQKIQKCDKNIVEEFPKKLLKAFRDICSWAPRTSCRVVSSSNCWINFAGITVGISPDISEEIPKKKQNISQAKFRKVSNKMAESPKKLLKKL